MLLEDGFAIPNFMPGRRSAPFGQDRVCARVPADRDIRLAGNRPKLVPAQAKSAHQVLRAKVGLGPRERPWRRTRTPRDRRVISGRSLRTRVAFHAAYAS